MNIGPKLSEIVLYVCGWNLSKAYLQFYPILTQAVAESLTSVFVRQPYFPPLFSLTSEYVSQSLKGVCQGTIFGPKIHQKGISRIISVVGLCINPPTDHQCRATFSKLDFSSFQIHKLILYNCRSVCCIRIAFCHFLGRKISSLLLQVLNKHHILLDANNALTV